MANVNIPDLTTLSGIDRTADLFEVYDLSASQNKKTTLNSALGFTGGDPVSTTDTQSVTNKTLDNTNTITLKDTLFTLQDDGDTTKQAKFQLSGITTATTRTYTLPNASSTLADTSTAQTFTNKTITSPTITGGTLDNTTVTVDSISEHTASNGVTVAGLNLKSGKLNTSNAVVTASYTNASVTADKLATGAATATVATSETTTSTSYANLTTTTDSVTVTVGANGLALVSVSADLSNSGAAVTNIDVDISGATTRAASDTTALKNPTTSVYGLSRTTLFTGLTAGSTTFKLKYKVGSGTGTFLNRSISVVPL